ncbi:MAG: methylated-DNA--[protein]-cysteine S-methyltransferase [Rhodospirillum sp.]|nr:methylated-DNA--[protein]-cysteine S-methyltransferase [Rhodospirillum sp.]MCF8491663.1 methylated-DNA--[protein]-cysteine S-methyltransferase [Rhodospirillum sp.]
MIHLFRDRIESPLGEILVFSDGTALRAVEFADYEHRGTALLTKAVGPHRVGPAKDPGGASSALKAYFDGDLNALDAVAVEPGGTPFQRMVWLGLRTIPAGETLSYGTFAARLGVAKAVRAVGRTNGLNPIAIILPCHRVIGANGTLTGYAGGLERKAWLLKHEGWTSPPDRGAPPEPAMGDLFRD